MLIEHSVWFKPEALGLGSSLVEVMIPPFILFVFWVVNFGVFSFDCFDVFLCLLLFALDVGLVFFFLTWVVNASTFDFFSRFPGMENGGMNFIFSVSEQLL